MAEVTTTISRLMELRCAFLPHSREYESITDAIVFMKNKEPVNIEIEGGGNSWWHVCEECHGAVDHSDHFCKHCGRPFNKPNAGPTQK